MRKTSLSLALILFLSVLAMACSSSPANVSNGEKGAASKEKGNSSGKSTKIDAAVFHSETDPFNDTWKEFTKGVQDAVGGSVQFKSFYNGSLVSNTDTLNAVKDGSVHMGVTAAAVMSGQIPALAQLEVLAGYPNDPQQFDSLLQEIWPVLKDIFRKQGVEFIWLQGAPGTVAISRDKFFKTSEDFKGVKVRAAGRWQTEQIKTLGGNPIAIDIGEVYLALQSKTLDAALSLNTLTNSFKFYEVAPKITQLDVPSNATFYIMNKKVWDQLPQEVRAKMDEIGMESAKRSFRHLHEIQKEAIDNLKTKGAQIYNLTEEEHQKFVSQMSPVFEKLSGLGGEEGTKLAQIMDKYRKAK